MKTNEIEREKINNDVAEFLKAGGKIQTVDHTANHEAKQPIKRTRKENREYSKRIHQIPKN